MTLNRTAKESDRDRELLYSPSEPVSFCRRARILRELIGCFSKFSFYLVSGCWHRAIPLQLGLVCLCLLCNFSVNYVFSHQARPR